MCLSNAAIAATIRVFATTTFLPWSLSITATISAIVGCCGSVFCKHHYMVSNLVMVVAGKNTAFCCWLAVVGGVA